jgi:hypothetical protein
LTKNDRHFLLVGDIPTFKHSVHSLLHAKCSARHLQRPNKPTFSKNAIFHPILTKIYCNFLYVGANSTFKRSFHSLLHAKCSAHHFQRRNKPTFSMNAIIHQILTKNANNFLPDRHISMLKRTNCYILRVERAACRHKRHDKTQQTAKYDHSSILTKNDRNFLLVGDIPTFKHSVHSLLHAKCSARHFQRPNKPTFSKNAIFHPILTKIYCNFLYVGANSTFKRSFHSLLHAKCSARYFQRRNKLTFFKNASINRILTKNDHNCLPHRDISMLKRTNCCILRVERGACRNKRQDKPNKS